MGRICIRKSHSVSSSLGSGHSNERRRHGDNVADPHHRDAEPDPGPAFDFDVDPDSDPDPTFNSEADPDPTTHFFSIVPSTAPK